jgi:hypothetical protein
LASVAPQLSGHLPCAIPGLHPRQRPVVRLPFDLSERRLEQAEVQIDCFDKLSCEPDAARAFADGLLAEHVYPAIEVWEGQRQVHEARKTPSGT